MPITVCNTALAGFNPNEKFTKGAANVAIVPTKSVLANMRSRSEGPCELYLIRASCIMSPIFTPLGHATSQRLQLRYTSLSYH